MRDEEYLKDLAQELRWRRIDDDTVVDILREVVSEASETDRSPQESFGAAADYAEKFERGRALPPGFVAGTVVALLATVAAAAHAVSTMIATSATSIGVSVAIYAICLIVMISAVVAGQRYDRRLPWSPETMTGISVEGLNRRYGRVTVLRDVTFRCPAGQITGLLGPNGSGKTSILRFLTELSPGGVGTATFDGRRYGEIEQPAREVGVLLDAGAHHPGRSVWETVRAAGLLMGVSRESTHETVSRLGLGSVRSRRFGALSLGMKQRVGLAVALLGSPRFLILDEPINGLDVESIRWLREMLVTFAREDGGTVLISSHVLQELESYADRVVILSRGEVVMEASLEALRSAVTCEVVAGDPARLRSLLNEQAIGWRSTPISNRIVVDADSRALAQLALDHRVLLTELVPSRRGGLEDIYLSATSGEFTAVGTEVTSR